MSARNCRVSVRTVSVFTSLGLVALLAACGGPGTPGDTSEPQVRVTSPSTSDSASYQLTGVALDNVEVTEATYTLGDGDAQPLTLTDGDFAVTVNLANGDNHFTVTATDAAGNVGSDSMTVVFNAPPGEATADVDIAAHGDSVTFTGSYFGDSGTVLVGGVEATVDTWSDGEVTFTVPADAPGGPQEVAIESANGGTSFDLFVGVDFEEGTLEDLAALGLPSGTAVRLGAGTFEQTSAEILLEGISLYGQGVGETIVDSGPGPQVLSVQAGYGQELVFDGFELHTDAFILGSSAPGSVADMDLASLDVQALVRPALEDLTAAGELSAMGGNSGSITMSNLLIEENVGSGGLLTLDMASGSPYQGSLIVENVEYESATAVLGLLSFGDITIIDSMLDANTVTIAAFGGGVSVTGSTLENGGSSAGILGGNGILAQDGIEIHDSEITSYANIPYFLAPVEVMLGSGSSLADFGSINITDSSFEMLSADPVTETDAGVLVLFGGLGSNTVSGNTFVAHRSVMLGEHGGSLDINDNQFQIGHDAVPDSPLVFDQLADFPGFIDFRNNTVEWQATGGVFLQAVNGFRIEGNTFDGGGLALELNENGGYLAVDTTISNNDFTGYDAAIAIDLEGASGEEGAITVTGNNFDFPIDGPGDVAVLADVVNATIDLDGNRWGGETDVALLNSFITRTGSTPPDMTEITSVIP